MLWAFSRPPGREYRFEKQVFAGHLCISPPDPRHLADAREPVRYFLNFLAIWAVSVK